MTAFFADIEKNSTKLLALYWAGYVVLFGFIQGFAANDIVTAFYNELFGLPVKVLFVWLVTVPLMNRFFFNRRFGPLFLAYVGLLFVFALLLRLIDNYIILAYLLTHWSKQPLLSTPPFVYNLVKLQFVMTIPFCYRMFSFWTREQHRVQAIKAEKLQAELQALQSGFHPHFLFNALNGLYAKILTGQEDAGDMLLRISSLLRFSVYEAKDTTIPLHTELAYLRNYVDLQKMRFEDRVQVCFTVSGDTGSHSIEPFLLLPFIENAFKHCTYEESAAGWITIYMHEQEGQLSLRIENSRSAVAQPAEAKDAGGFGLAFVVRRLELLYPKKHSLKVVAGEDSYFISLKLPLHAAS